MGNLTHVIFVFDAYPAYINSNVSASLNVYGVNIIA